MAENREPFNSPGRRHFRRRFDAIGRSLGFEAQTPEQWRLWRRKLRRTVRQCLGLGRMEEAPLRARITGQEDAGDHIRQSVEIQTEPGVIMPLFVLIPKTPKGPWPAVMALHGHVSGGKVAVAGVPTCPEVVEATAGYNNAYGLSFVREGCIVFCPDARGFGARQENPAQQGPLESSCNWLQSMALPLGQTLAGMWTWDLHRLIDYIQTRKDSQPGTLGCVGLSGGGLQALYATALDDRITCATISGYFYGVKKSLLDMNCCDCNYVPRLWEYADMGDLGALIAPRPLCIETGTQDWLNGADKQGRPCLQNVRRQVRITRAAYRLLGETRNLKHVIFEGPHQWHGKSSVPFMRSHLQE